MFKTGTIILSIVLINVAAAGKSNRAAAPAESAGRKSTSASAPKTAHVVEDKNSIEHVNEEKIDEIVNDGIKNLVIFFYDGKTKCPSCNDALAVLEEIDDDLEETGFIEVVKTDDRNVARELGVHTFPSLVYFRRRSPILYDGGFDDGATALLRWLRSHEEVACASLTDYDFEDRTDCYAPDDGSLDWFVMFYNSKDDDCEAYEAVWEATAHKLRGIVHLGKVDVEQSDDVALRFKIDDDDECPTFLLFHKGKMYRYKDSAREVDSFVAFALHKFKEQRGHRIPEPPTMIEEIYEELKENVEELLTEHWMATAIGVGVASTLLIVGISIYCVRLYRTSAKKQT